MYSLYRATMNKNVQVWGSDIAVLEDACLVVCDTACLGKRLSMFQKNVSPSSSAFPGGPWKMKAACYCEELAACYCEELATCYCEELCYITEEWSP
jgi:hypothetical protein